MARKKYKLTGFARFFIVMLFLAPIAYFTAIYINEGESGIDSLFNDDGPQKTTTTVDSDKSKSELEAENAMLLDSIRTLNLEYQELKRQNRLLEREAGN